MLSSPHYKRGGYTRERVRKRQQYIVAGFSVCVAIGIGITCWLAVPQPVKHAASPAAAQQVVPVAKRLAMLAGNPDSKTNHHPVYPYSVIAGGAHSPDELRAAMSRDQVVREHYRGFDVDKVRVERLSRPRLSYVSFRKDNQIFWTRKQLKLEAGELVLTDGKNYARTRCGNRLSDTPVVHLTSPDIADDVVEVMPPDVKLLAGLDFGLDHTFKPALWMSPSPSASAADAQPSGQLSPAGFGGYGGGGGGFPYVPGRTTGTGSSGSGTGGGASPAILPRTSPSSGGDPSDPTNSQGNNPPIQNGGGGTGNPPGTQNPVTTPEPAAGLLLVPGLAVLAVFRKSLLRG